MKRLLKIMLISFAAVIGGLGLLIGGMYLFGGFDEKPVYATTMYFREGVVKTSTSFSMDLLTNTEGVNKTQVTLTTDGGDGDTIIDYPRTVNIGSSFWITPKRDASGKNIGGTVTLRARYSDVNANSVATATCKILIDVPVEEVSLSHISTKNYGGNFVIAHSGDSLNTLIESITPSSSLSPYVSPNRLSTAGITITDKAIYLAVTLNGIVNEEKVCFDLGNGDTSHLLKVGYSYDNATNSFVLDKDVSIIVGQENVNVELTCFVVPTYAIQEGKWGDTISLSDLKKMKLVSNSTTFFVKNYSIDNMAINNNIVTQSRNIYINEEIKFYINNPNLDANSSDINLGIELQNNHNITPSDELIKQDVKAYVHIGDTVTQLELENTNQPSKSTWCFKYTFDSFLVYYNYSQTTGINDNKIMIEIVYEDSDKEEEDYIRRFFYLNPSIHTAEGLVVMYQNNQDSFVINNGEAFDIKDKVDIIGSGYIDGAKVAYYIPDNEQNALATMPTQTGFYKLVFDITFNEDISINTLRAVEGWTQFNSWDCTATFTQGSIERVITYSAGKPSVTDENVTFVKDIPIHVEISKVKLENVTDDFASITNSLLQITTNNNVVYVSNKDIKFYQITSVGGSDTVSDLPYIKIGGVEYAIDFDFYKDKSNNKYIHINDSSVNASYVVKGLGSFIINAQLVYEEGNVYWLGMSAEVKVKVTETLDAITIYKGQKDTKFDGQTLTYNESNAQEERTGRLYITSDKMEALRTFVEHGKIYITVEQDFGPEIDVTIKDDSDIKSSYGIPEDGSLSNEQVALIKTKLANINKNTVSFSSSWIVDEGSGRTPKGYYIDYVVGEVETIYIGTTALSNSFSLVVYAKENNEAPAIVARFSLISELKDKLFLNVEDNSLQYSRVCYKEDINSSSMSIKASTMVTSTTTSKFAWMVNNNPSALKTSFEMVCGFNYTSTGTDDIKTGLKWSLKEVKANGDTVDLSADFCSLALNDSGNYELTIKNLPYRIGSFDLRFTIYSDIISANNTHRAWNSSSHEFTSIINAGVKNGAYFDFNVTTTEIQITVNNLDVVGAKNGETRVLSNETDGIFKVELLDINNTSGIDYTTFFKVDIVREGNYADAELSKNNTTNVLNVRFNNDFLADGYIKFRFTYFDGKPLHIDGTTQNIYSKTIKSAYEFTFLTDLVAPEFAPQDFYNLEYLGATLSPVFEYLPSGEEINLERTDLDGKVFLTMTNVNNDARFAFDASGKIILKATSLAYNPIIRFDLQQVVDGEIRSNSQQTNTDITVTPKYSSDDLQFIDLDGDNLPFIYAGQENAISFNSTNTGKLSLTEGAGHIYQDKGKISRVDISFENYSDNSHPADTLVATAHMAQMDDKTIANTGLYSYDLTYDKMINVTFTFSFTDDTYGAFGTYSITKQMSVLKNIEVTWNRNIQTPGELTSGKTLNLSNGNNYEVNYISGANSGQTGPIIQDFFDYGNSDRIYFYGKTGEQDQTGQDIYVYSFEFSDYEQYFDVSIKDDGNPFLALSLNTGSPDQVENVVDVNITITFYYIVVEGSMQMYQIAVEMPLVLHITKPGQ